MRLLVVIVILTTAMAEAASAQEVATKTVPPGGADTFPAGLGYSALALAGTVYASLIAVIKTLYTEKKQSEEVHARALVAKDDAHKVEMNQRREEVEKLLREQQTIMRDALTSAGANTLALDKVGDALQEHSKLQQQILALLTKGDGKP